MDNNSNLKENIEFEFNLNKIDFERSLNHYQNKLDNLKKQRSIYLKIIDKIVPIFKEFNINISYFTLSQNESLQGFFKFKMSDYPQEHLVLFLNEIEKVDIIRNVYL